ncbi:NINE protein [Propionicicella superfundia]|uniref:NINE protein n=1 Tax=Propionicicella superfundia TaxID=348582 RepID=UPI00041F8903|nr:TM2 domain-containing protein [Propionicicella superfundia]
MSQDDIPQWRNPQPAPRDPTLPYPTAGQPPLPAQHDGYHYENYTAPANPSVGWAPPAPLQPPPPVAVPVPLVAVPVPLVGPPYAPTYVAAPYGVDPATGLPYSSKSKIAAGLLGIFLGGLGIGRFYTGHVGLGIAQLLLTVFGFGAGSIWGFIDGIVMLAGSPRDSNGLPLH